MAAGASKAAARLSHSKLGEAGDALAEQRVAGRRRLSGVQRSRAFHYRDVERGIERQHHRIAEQGFHRSLEYQRREEPHDLRRIETERGKGGIEFRNEIDQCLGEIWERLQQRLITRVAEPFECVFSAIYDSLFAFKKIKVRLHGSRVIVDHKAHDLSRVAVSRGFVL